MTGPTLCDYCRRAAGGGCKVYPQVTLTCQEVDVLSCQRTEVAMVLAKSLRDGGGHPVWQVFVKVLDHAD